MKHRVTKAIFPVAGMGTRFLPATRTMPTDVLPLIDQPLFQCAIDEARGETISDFIFVTAREDCFDAVPEPERMPRDKGKDDLLATVGDSNMEPGTVANVRQTGPGRVRACPGGSSRGVLRLAQRNEGVITGGGMRTRSTP